MIRVVNGTDSELHTFYELLRIYFPAYEISGELFLIIDTLSEGKRVTLIIGDARYENTFSGADEFELKRKISAWIAKEVDHPDKEPSSWGSLTGTRPIKFLQKHRRRLGDNGAFRHLTDDYLVDPKVASLLMEIARRESRLTKDFLGRGYSLYIIFPSVPRAVSIAAIPPSEALIKKRLKYIWTFF
mgnify:CR=1 FL=1